MRLYTGPLVGRGPAAEKTGPGIDLSRSLLILSPAGRPLAVSPFLFSSPATTGSTCIQLPRQNRIEIAPAPGEVVAIYINSRR